MASKIAPFKGQEGALESEYGNETRPTFLSTTRENAIASKRYIQSHPGRWPCKLKVSRSLTFVDEPRRASLSERVARNQYSKRRIKRSSVTCASQVSNSCESLRELAKAALTARETTVAEDGKLGNTEEGNVRESIRRIQAYALRDAPIDLSIRETMCFNNKRVDVTLDRDFIIWFRRQVQTVSFRSYYAQYFIRSKEAGRIQTDDIIGAEVMKPHQLRIHYFIKGKGTGDRTLRRRYKITQFSCMVEVAARWVSLIQELVRWQARAPPFREKRRIHIIINPHSGKRKARQIWHKRAKVYFELGNFACTVLETVRSGHAIEMGQQFKIENGYEAIVFVGGDGTICEFMNGLVHRPEKEWREIVASTPISLLCAGTQNAFGVGVGIPTLEAAIFCIIKRKIRPLDVIAVVAEHKPHIVHFSYCGVGWGIAGDIAAESERYRSLGTSRYAFLKLKRSIWKRKKHMGRIRYVPVDPPPKLQVYHDIKNEGAVDQFEVEEANTYDATCRKSWLGISSAIQRPCSPQRYHETLWREESGNFLVLGVINTAPDGKFAHPSDGYLDLLISRKGNILRMLQLGILYLFHKELQSPLLTYLKVKAVVIHSDQESDCLNNDGEVLSGPGPWRLEVVPSLFNALSEK
ncbi:hypothetical protein ABG067_006797 [Albugo candida]